MWFWVFLRAPQILFAVFPSRKSLVPTAIAVAVLSSCIHLTSWRLLEPNNPLCSQCLSSFLFSVMKLDKRLFWSHTNKMKWCEIWVSSRRWRFKSWSSEVMTPHHYTTTRKLSTIFVNLSRKVCRDRSGIVYLRDMGSTGKSNRYFWLSGYPQVVTKMF